MAQHRCRSGAAAYIERPGPHGEPLAVPLYPLEMANTIVREVVAGDPDPACPCCGRLLTRENRRRRAADDPIVFRCRPCGRGALIRPATI